MDTRHCAGRCLLTEGSLCPRVESVYAIVPWVHKIYKHKVVSIIYLRAANSQQTANMLVRCGLARATIPALMPVVQPGNKLHSSSAGWHRARAPWRPLPTLWERAWADLPWACSHGKQLLATGHTFRFKKNLPLTLWTLPRCSYRTWSWLRKASVT